MDWSGWICAGDMKRQVRPVFDLGLDVHDAET